MEKVFCSYQEFFGTLGKGVVLDIVAGLVVCQGTWDGTTLKINCPKSKDVLHHGCLYTLEVDAVPSGGGRWQCSIHSVDSVANSSNKALSVLYSDDNFSPRYETRFYIMDQIQCTYSDGYIHL